VNSGWPSPKAPPAFLEKILIVHSDFGASVLEEEGAVMDVKPTTSQGPATIPVDQNEITEQKSVPQQETGTAADTQNISDTRRAMMQAGTETKSSMKTSEMFIQQQLAGQLRNVPQFGAGTANAANVATADPGLEKARKEAQVWMDHGNKMLKEHRYNEALEDFETGFRTYPAPAFLLNKASTLLDAGRYSEAVMAYERYLSDPDAPRADEAKAAMERAKEMMGGREATMTGVVESRKEYDKGAEAFKAGKYQEALDSFEKAYELNPMADFKYNQAAALEKLGRPYAAADQFQEYLKMKPDAKDAAAVNDKMNKLRAEGDKKPITASGQAGGQEWITRGNRLLFAHKYDDAVRAYEEGFRTYPDRAFMLNKAAALVDGGRYSEAVREYERYLSDPEAPRADEAKAALERAKAGVAKEQSHDEYDKGALAYKAGKYQEALEAFQKAYELNPLPEFKYNMGASLEKLGRPYAAAERYSEYAKEKPNAPDAQRMNIKAEKLRTEADKAPITASGHEGGQEWILRGNRLLTAHKYNEAVNAFEEGFRTYPDRAFILNKAAALLDGGRYAEADLAYQNYLSDPDAPRADEARKAQERARAHMGGKEATSTGVAESEKQFEQGNNFYKEGKYGDALQAYERAYQQNPLGALRYNQAAALDKMGRREMAAQRYEAYLSETPDAPDAAKVKAHITKLRAEALKDAQAAFDRGQQAYNAGRFTEAAHAFAEAYEQKPFPQFLYNIGASYDKAGDTQRAVQNYQLYLSMNPNANDADRVRKRIHLLLQATGADLMQP
jgi:tetratricopeptide (TPR) repeat protein